MIVLFNGYLFVLCKDRWICSICERIKNSVLLQNGICIKHIVCIPNFTEEVNDAKCESCVSINTNVGEKPTEQASIEAHGNCNWHWQTPCDIYLFIYLILSFTRTGLDLFA